MCYHFLMDPIYSLISLFRENVDSEIALGQSAYMKNLFPFLGLKRPARNELQKKFFRDFSGDAVKAFSLLWEQPEREFQYAALDLAMKCHREWDESFFHLFCEKITEKLWWDSVDLIASNLIGRYILQNPKHKELMEKWITDENLWRRRTAILHQLKWKESTDEEKLFQYCTLCSGEKEFFIRKAIGWALREYSKTNPEAVRDFIDNTSLQPLSIREGSRHIFSESE